jgi:hypothetical protein
MLLASYRELPLAWPLLPVSTVLVFLLPFLLAWSG